jgi:hypothetical protein
MYNSIRAGRGIGQTNIASIGLRILLMVTLQRRVIVRKQKVAPSNESINGAENIKKARSQHEHIRIKMSASKTVWSGKPLH